MTWHTHYIWAFTLWKHMKFLVGLLLGFKVEKSPKSTPFTDNLPSTGTTGDDFTNWLKSVLALNSNTKWYSSWLSLSLLMKSPPDHNALVWDNVGPIPVMCALFGKVATLCHLAFYPLPASIFFTEMRFAYFSIYTTINNVIFILFTIHHLFRGWSRGFLVKMENLKNLGRVRTRIILWELKYKIQFDSIYTCIAYI